MRRAIYILVFVLGLASCTGQLPTSGTLPKIDGSQVTSVDARSVGGAAPSSESQGSTLVKRDDSGNFSAGTITANLNGSASSAGVAGFARGQVGASVASSSIVTIPSDGDYFTMTGTQDVTSLAPAPEGTRVRFRMNDKLFLRHSAGLDLMGKKDYRTGAGDFFEFLSLGAAGWVETGRRVATPGEVIRRNASGAVSTDFNAPSTIILGGAAAGDIDDLAEYSAGGEFTAYHGGVYEISAGYVVTFTYTVGAAQFCELAIMGPISYFNRTFSTNANYCAPQLTSVLTLKPDDKFSIKGSSGPVSTAITGSGTINYLHVVRIRD